MSSCSKDHALPPTEMLYMTYEGNWMTECQATVLEVKMEADADAATAAAHIVLDQTVMHAQGGGQPTDTGQIVCGETIADVTKVLIDRSTGIASHTCLVAADNKETTTTTTLPAAGETVKVVLDQDRRRILSECHTAGHVIDSAMARCGYTMKPSKAYHFLDSPYVEYSGTIPPDQREAVLADLQVAFCQLVQEDVDTEIALVSKQEADRMCNRQAQNFDMDVFCDPRTETIRVVTIAGYPCPCGGTHVRSTGELAANQWGVTGIKSKKGVVRIKYGQGTKVAK